MKRIIGVIIAVLLVASVLPGSAYAHSSGHSNHKSNSRSSCSGSNHSWGSWHEGKSASCMEQGTKYKTCKNCGVKKTATTDKASHHWGEWQETVCVTAYSTGISERVCADCGSKQTQDVYPECTLKIGDKGSEVEELQHLLNTAGFDCGKVDGKFGKNTQKAVAAYQEAHGYTPDGIAWSGIIAELSCEEETAHIGGCCALSCGAAAAQ